MLPERLPVRASGFSRWSQLRFRVTIVVMRRTVVIVDDHSQFRRSARKLLELEGFAAGPLRLSIPTCQVRLDVQPSARAAASVEVPARLRSIHIDADRGLLLCAHALSFRYHPRRAPRSLRVARLIGAAA